MRSGGRSRRALRTGLVALAAAAGVLAAPAAAQAYTTVPQYKATDFATGFANTGPGGVGPVGLAFDATNHLWVMDYANGLLYRFDSNGGAADAAHQVTVGPSPWGGSNATGIAFSKSGRLYVALQRSNRVDEVDLATGGIARTLSPVMTLPAPPGFPGLQLPVSTNCATGIATDPVSGDLLVTDPCPGYSTRILDPDGSSTPNALQSQQPYWADGLTFAPDGSIWTTYHGDTLVHVDADGTTFHYLAYIPTLDGTAISTGADGSVFANTNNGQVVRYDPTTNTQAAIFSGGSRGDFSTVGPDGCLYITQTDRIVKITNADGSCSWSPTTALPTATLTPASQSPHVGEGATVTATLSNVPSPAGTVVTFTVTGANPQTLTATADASGVATATYHGAAQGTDTVTASTTVGTVDVESNPVTVDWQAPLDSTPPVIVPTVDGPAGDNGWYVGDTTVTWSVTDPESGVASSTGCDPVTLSGYHAGELLTCSATNGVGLSSSASVTVRIDDTAPSVTPTVTGTLGDNGWYVSPVTVSWATADDESGIATTTGCDAVTYTSDAASLTSTCTARNGAGLERTSSVQFRIDQTPPSVTYSGDAGTYDVDQAVAITCAADDALSGVVSDTCADANGSAWSFGVGTHSLSATATDGAGNVGAGSATFTVVVTGPGLCRLVQAWSTKPGVASSLCAKLDAAAAASARGQLATAQNVLGAFRNEVAAQRGKAISAAPADELVLLSGSL